MLSYTILSGFSYLLVGIHQNIYLTAGAGGGCGRNVRNPFKINAIATDRKWILEA